MRVDIDAEQRRLRHIDMAVCNQFREVGVEEGEQQHLNVRTIDIGIRQDGDFAVAQAAQIGAIVFAVRIDADGHGNIVDFGVAEKLVAVGFKAVEHFAAQGQNGLGGFVACEFGRAAGGIAFH